MFDRQPRLVGETVELRPLRADDYHALRTAAADPLIWEQHPANRHEEAVFRAYFDEQLGSGGGLAIVDRAAGELSGSSRYHGYDEARSEVAFDRASTHAGAASGGGAGDRRESADARRLGRVRAGRFRVRQARE